MERAVAIKKLVKMFGKSAAWRVNPKAPTPDEREAATAAMPAALAESITLKNKLEARYKAILAADAEYQSLLVARQAASKKVDHLRSITLCHKITIGKIEMGFFHVKAEGDSWEEAFAKLEAKRAAA
jgi:hypothetical protein